MYSVRKVKVAPCFLQKHRRTGFAVCPQFRESYPVADGVVCLGCQGAGLYESCAEDGLDANPQITALGGSVIANPIPNRRKPEGSFVSRAFMLLPEERPVLNNQRSSVKVLAFKSK
jgi:hypothetical protein